MKTRHGCAIFYLASHGNWIVKKEYGFRGDEVVIKNWWEREITYGRSGYSVIERFEKHVESLRLEKERKEAEQRAWLARPELAQPSDNLIQFMRPLFSYPDASNYSYYATSLTP